jgi:hypothetical protein
MITEQQLIEALQNTIKAQNETISLLKSELERLKTVSLPLHGNPYINITPSFPIKIDPLAPPYTITYTTSSDGQGNITTTSSSPVGTEFVSGCVSVF